MREDTPRVKYTNNIFSEKLIESHPVTQSVGQGLMLSAFPSSLLEMQRSTSDLLNQTPHLNEFLMIFVCENLRSIALKEESANYGHQVKSGLFL